MYIYISTFRKVLTLDIGTIFPSVYGLHVPHYPIGRMNYPTRLAATTLSDKIYAIRFAWYLLAENVTFHRLVWPVYPRNSNLGLYKTAFSLLCQSLLAMWSHPLSPRH